MDSIWQFTTCTVLKQDFRHAQLLEYQRNTKACGEMRIGIFIAAFRNEVGSSRVGSEGENKRLTSVNRLGGSRPMSFEG